MVSATSSTHLLAFCPFSIIRELPRWRRPAPPPLSFKNPLQKPTGDVTDTTSIFFTVYGRHPCTQPFQLLTLLICRINHFHLESNVIILNIGMQKVSYLLLRLESLPGQENMTILLQFYSLCTGYLLSFVSVTKYYYLPIRP